MDDGLLSLKWNNHKATFFHKLASLRKKQCYTDVTLACEGKYFSVHKLVLSTCSDYFCEIFEQTTCKSPVVILKDIRHNDLQSLLDYMYIGEVDVKQSDLPGLIKAAECLRIKGLSVLEEEISNYATPKKSTHSQEQRNSPPSKKQRIESPFPQIILGRAHSPVYHSSSSFNSKSIPNQSISDEISYVPSQSANYLCSDPPTNRVHQQSSCSLIPIETIKLEVDNDEEESVHLSTQPSDPLFSEEESGLAEGNEGRPKQENDDQAKEFVSHSEQIGKEEHDPEDIYDGDDQLPGPSTFQEDPPLLPWGADEDSFSDNPFGGEDSSHQQVTQSGRDGHYNYCHFCTKTFRFKLDLKRHMRTHTGERPFQCFFCPYRATQEINLKTHMRTHSDEKPFSCAHCTYKARFKHCLQRHIKGVHRKK